MPFSRQLCGNPWEKISPKFSNLEIKSKLKYKMENHFRPQFTRRKLSHKTQNRSSSLFSDGLRRGGRRSHLWRRALSAASLSNYRSLSLSLRDKRLKISLFASPILYQVKIDQTITLSKQSFKFSAFLILRFSSSISLI